MSFELVGASETNSGIVIGGVSVDDHSTQALIEMFYIKVGNEILATQLHDLEEALELTKRAIDVLDKIQFLHNQITVMSKGSFTGTNIEDFETEASTFFGEPIFPSALAGFASLWPSMEAAKAELASVIAALLAANPGAGGDPNSLVSRLTTVQSELPAAQGNFESWILDKYNLTTTADTAQAGAIQANITFAITAAESLNDTQKEEVRRYLFVFEEYYKSASAILNAINKIIEKIAQNIAR